VRNNARASALQIPHAHSTLLCRDIACGVSARRAIRACARRWITAFRSSSLAAPRASKIAAAHSRSTLPSTMIICQGSLPLLSARALRRESGIIAAVTAVRPSAKFATPADGDVCCYCCAASTIAAGMTRATQYCPLSQRTADEPLSSARH
jgi:hypothetical protein